MNITDAIGKKIEARCRPVSQLNPSNPLGGYLRRWASEAGTASGYALAEAFHYYGL